MKRKIFLMVHQKLCMALGIDKGENGINTISSEEIYVEDDSLIKKDFSIVEAKRIGIDYAEEARDFYGDFILRIINLSLKNNK